ncbi:MAG: hypothetical protein WAV28_08715 [Sedimentisphaerales bacterium]|jgi:transposase
MFERYLTDKDWHQVQEGVEVKLVHGPNGEELFVLARSTDRRQKEHTMHQRFIDRMEADLQKMQHCAQSGRLKDIQLAHRRLGRIQQRYWRASSAFDVKIVTTKKPAGKARLKITFKRNKQWSDWAQLSEGYYLLRTNLTNIDPKTLWKRYIQLTEAEWAFRITKDELVIRPIWHQKADRGQSTYLGLLFGLCTVEKLGPMDEASWFRRCSSSTAGRICQNQKRRCRFACSHER